MAQATTTDTSAAPNALGRRAQQKASTRAAITLAAQRLISLRGFDEVTVGDIAAEAAVSHRTFYRYFPSKEEAMLAGFRDFLNDFVALIAARPAEEQPLDSLLQTLDTIATAMPVDPDGFRQIYELIEGEPALGGVQHRLLVEAQDRLTGIFAQRLRMPATSLEPRLFAAAATASYQAALRTWVVMPPDERTMTIWALGRQALERFANGLGAEDGG
jgi:AcrR family transcriptional regulator